MKPPSDGWKRDAAMYRHVFTARTERIVARRFISEFALRQSAYPDALKANAETSARCALAKAEGTTSDRSVVFYRALGRVIRRTRRQRRPRITQQNLADALGIHRVSVARIEGGRWHIEVYRLVEIARALDISAARLLLDALMEVP